MNFVKQYLFLIVLSTILLIITCVGGYFIFSTSKKASDFATQVEEIKDQLDAFTKSTYPIKPVTVDKAEANQKIAAEAYKTLLAEVVAKTAVPPADVATLSPIGAKNRIDKGCTKMENMLNGNGVAFGPDMRNFTFGAYMDPTKLPKTEEIPLILKNMEVVQELIYLVANANVSVLNSFGRTATLDPTRRDLFNYLSFNVSVSGDIESIRRLINSCDNATYHFFVRAVSLSSAAAITDGDGIAAGTSKIDRLVLNKPAPITAALQIDYVEFHDKE